MNLLHTIHVVTQLSVSLMTDSLTVICFRLSPVFVSLAKTAFPVSACFELSNRRVGMPVLVPNPLNYTWIIPFAARALAPSEQAEFARKFHLVSIVMALTSPCAQQILCLVCSADVN